MTAIVHGAETKAQLSLIVNGINEWDELVREGLANPELLPITAYIEDPAVHDSMKGYEGYLHEMPIGTTVTVTNHPKRSFFAKLTRTSTKWEIS